MPTASLVPVAIPLKGLEKYPDWNVFVLPLLLEK